MLRSIEEGVTVLMGVLVLLPAVLFSHDEELQEMYEEYMQLNHQLQMIQQEALADETVAEAADEYSALVDKKIVEINPDAVELLENRDETLKALETAQVRGDMEAAQELQHEYQQIAAELNTYQAVVMMDEEVLEKRGEFESILLAKMEEIDSNVPEMLERMRWLAAEIEQRR